MKIKPNDSNIFKIITVLFTVFISTLVYSQTYPVQVTPQLIPPYSLKLSDYATTTSEKLYTNILLTDVNEVGRRIRLKMYIEGQGLSITTQDIIAGETPIYVDGGINLRLSNLDLQAYFQLNNLVGITPGQYNVPLPNGGYDFCFEVYDYFTNRKLSAKSCTTVYLLQNDPPILNLPFKDNIVNATNPQNILFTWTPRHSNVSNVQYEFTLKELWDVQNPQANFLASVPFYQTTTYSTTLLVGPEAPQLLSGKIYGWQVRAFVSDGINETSVFKNDGKSEIFWFKYLEDCQPPSFVISQALTAESVQVNWQSSEHLRYRIQYRKKGFGDDDWFEVNSYTNEGKIRNLEPATVYEFRVGGECTQLSGFAYSNIQEFTTPSNDEAAYYNCGLTPQINITNKEPLPKLGINETFTAGDFPVTTREVTGSNGTFSGWGYITLPFLENLKEIIDAANIATGGKVNIGKYTRIKVVFDNVQVNSSYELIEGVVETDYDPEWGGIIDTDEIIDDIGGDRGNIENFDATNTDIKDVKVDENGNVVIIPEEGDPIPIETGKPVTITDKNGDQWTVHEDGKVTEGKAAEGGTPTADNTEGISSAGNVKQISSKDVRVTFTPSGYYGTDTYQDHIKSDKYKSEYEFIKTHDNKDYSVLYKLLSDLPEHKTDIIKATVNFSNGKTKDDIVFKTKEGTAISPTWSGNEATLPLQRKFEFAKEEILATVKPKDSTGKFTVAGKLNVWHAQQQTINLTLVSVDGASVSNVGDRINEIYNKAGIHFNIKTESINLGLGSLDVGDSDMLSNYTEGEKSIISTFKNGRTIAKDQYYMFFLDKEKTTLSKDLDGFMPLKRQFGFVFTKQDAGRVAAHELGHGIFGLKHPFDEYDAESAKNENHYLMSYGTGIAFSHMDWQKLHAPGIQLYWFQGDEAGEYRNGYLISKIIQELRCKYKNQDLIIDDYLDSYIKRAVFYDKSWGKESKPFEVTLLKYKESTPSPVKCKIAIGRKNSLSQLKEAPIVYNKVHKVYGYTYEYDLGGIVVWSDFDLELDSDGSEFIGYLANDYALINVTADNNIEVSEDDKEKTEVLEQVIVTAVSLNSYINSLLMDNDISSKEFKIIKSIASCDAERLSIETRFKIIKLMSEQWIINEKKEDLVLDLFQTTKQEDYNVLLDKFKDSPKVYSSIAAGINDFIEGAEDNKRRLYDELFKVWSNSTYFNNPKYHAQNGGTYDSTIRNEEFYREVQKEIEGFILENFDSDCLNNYKNSSILDLLTCLELSPVTKIQEISYDDRKAILERILKFGSFASSSFNGRYEKPIIRLLKYTPEDFNHNTFINYLVNTSLTIPEGQHGKSIKATVVKLLFDKINDSFFVFTGDYRKELMEAFIYLKARSIGIDESVTEIKNGIENYDIDVVKDKLAFYSYDYRNILKRLFTSASLTPIATSFDPYLSLETELKDDDGTSPAKLTIEQTLKNGLVPVTLSKKEHNPFELILFLNLSKQPLLSDFTQANEEGKKSAAMVPAIVAHYASAEGDNQTKSDLIQTAVDVGSLAIPGGQIRSLGKLFYYADKISSLTSLMATFNREENPELAALFNEISIATGLIDLGDLATTGYKTLLKKRRKNIESLTSIQIKDNLVKHSEEVIKIIDNHPEQLKNLIRDGGNNKLEELANILENEKLALGKNIDETNTQKVEEAIEALRRFNSTTDIVFDLAKPYRGVKFDEFVKSVYDFKDGKNVDLAKQSFELWSKERWDELYDLFNPKSGDKINGGWPPYYGFYRKPEILTGKQIINGTSEFNKGNLFEGMYDRFQSMYQGKPSMNLAGGFASPVYKGEYNIDIPFTYDSRAILSDIEEGTVYIKFRMKDATGVEFKYGEALPWKNKEGKKLQGMAMQVQSNVNLKDIDPADYDIVQKSIYEGNGNWKHIVEDKSIKVDKILDKIKKCN